MNISVFYGSSLSRNKEIVKIPSNHHSPQPHRTCGQHLDDSIGNHDNRLVGSSARSLLRQGDIPRQCNS